MIVFYRLQENNQTLQFKIGFNNDNIYIKGNQIKEKIQHEDAVILS